MSDPLGMIGVVLAEKFRVERLLGEGGYGVVYAGTHLGLAEPIAVKFLKVESTGAEQFAREARILFSLAHPAIVRMYDVGEVQRGMARVPWVVLELLSGPTLEEELVTRRAQGRHFTVQELQRLFLPILDGLAFAHGRGIAHRDIKPANIVLSRPSPGREEPKLLDFGTARSQAAAFQTSAGHTGFTPLYAAPEQWDPTISQPGAATDVYAMGLTMLECASLQRAFAGADNVGALMRAVMSGTGRPSLMSARPDLPPALHAVIERATAVNPQARFRDAGELRVATEQALSGMAASGGLGVALPPVSPGASTAPPGFAGSTTNAPFVASQPMYGQPMQVQPMQAQAGGRSGAGTAALVVSLVALLLVVGVAGLAGAVYVRSYNVAKQNVVGVDSTPRAGAALSRPMVQPKDEFDMANAAKVMQAHHTEVDACWQKTQHWSGELMVDLTVRHRDGRVTGVTCNTRWPGAHDSKRPQLDPRAGEFCGCVQTVAPGWTFKPPLNDSPFPMADDTTWLKVLYSAQ